MASAWLKRRSQRNSRIFADATPIKEDLELLPVEEESAGSIKESVQEPSEQEQEEAEEEEKEYIENEEESSEESEGGSSDVSSLGEVVASYPKRGRAATMHNSVLQEASKWPGELCDFLERRRVLALDARLFGKQGIPVQQGITAKQDMKVLQTLFDALAEDEEDDIIAWGRFMLEQERITSALREQIMQELKDTPESAGGWPATPPEALRDWALRIVELRKKVKYTHEQVNAWLLQFKLLNVKVRDIRDITPEHRAKIVNFWCEYHSDAWDMGTNQSSGALGGRVFQATSAQRKNESSLSRSLQRSVSLGSLLNTSSQDLVRVENDTKRKLLPPVRDPRRMRYLRQCQSQARMPLALPFVIGQSTKLNVAGLDLTDDDILAIAEALPDAALVDDINLGENAMLSDRALEHLMKRLMRPGLTMKITNMSFSGCIRAGRHFQQALVNLMNDAFELRTLDLSRVKLSLKYQLPLCEAISNREALEVVNLMDTAMGGGTPSHRSKCITTLLQGKLRVLNLGWNSFDAEFFSILGQCLGQNASLTTLGLSNTAASGAETENVEESSTPVSHLIEQLWKAKPLQKLDISMNRIDFRAALVLDAAVEHHKALKQIILKDNPLGAWGVRCGLRTLTYKTNVLNYIDFAGCYSGEEPRDEDSLVFNPSNMGGGYDLSLENPYHRSILRMLYKTADRLKLEPDFLMQVSTPGYVHVKKNAEGFYDVPTEGEVSVNFNADRCLESSSFKDIKPSNFNGYLERFFDSTRHILPDEKAVQLFALWKELDGCNHEQTVFLRALSRDFGFSIANLMTLASTSQLFKAQCIICLLGAIPQESSNYYLSQMMYSTSMECIISRHKLRVLDSFNTSNPTGHYKLKLENAPDYAVAQRLMLLDKWEMLIDKRLGRFDLSQNHNGGHSRNEEFQGRRLSLIVDNFSDWNLPEYDDFELDYISSQIPAAGQATISNVFFDQFLLTLNMEYCSTSVKIAALRRVSHQFYIDSRQMRMIMGFFALAEERCEVMVTFFTRLVEVHHSKVYKVRLDNFEDHLQVQKRLGFARCFPYVQPENCQFELDLSYYDQRVCIANLVYLASREKIANIRNASYVLADGTVDELVMGVPRSWEQLDRVPCSGVFSCSYVCAPEDRNYSLRRQLCQTHTYYEMNLTEDQVSWWTGVNEAPSDVLEVLLFLMSNKDKKTPTLEKAFVFIDGVDGNGVITFRELTEGLEEMGFRFRGDTVRLRRSVTAMEAAQNNPDARERLHHVFRYLDPGGEGSISKQEWEVLSQLWREVQLSISELARFFLRTFNGNLDTAWSRLRDKAGSDRISERIFMDSIREMGYYGPVDVAFKRFDVSFDGVVTHEEFQLLKEFVTTITNQRLSMC